jgi:hypothetical protein
MNLWKEFRKWRAIKGYAKVLPGALLRDYGASPCYTPQPIKRSIERSGLNADYSCYALSMFADRAQFDEYHLGSGESCDFDSMRGEVAQSHFQGNPHFTFQDALSYATDSSTGADHAALNAPHGSDGHGGRH